MLTNQFVTNQKGMAVLEMIPILIVIVILLNFSYGFFGVIHTGILNSIAAKNYAFETFRNRSNLWYFRVKPDKDNHNYYGWNQRLHGIASDSRPSSSSAAIATERSISFMSGFGGPDNLGRTPASHESVFSIKDDGTRFNGKSGVNPVWIRPAYGICLNAKCQPD